MVTFVFTIMQPKKVEEQNNFKQKDRKTGRQKDRTSERQKDRKTKRQKDRKTLLQRISPCLKPKVNTTKMNLKKTNVILSFKVGWSVNKQERTLK
jgi:hypothetical protein